MLDIRIQKEKFQGNCQKFIPELIVEDTEVTKSTIVISGRAGEREVCFTFHLVESQVEYVEKNREEIFQGFGLTIQEAYMTKEKV